MNRLSEFGPIAALIKLWSDLTPAQRVVVISFIAVSIIAVALVGSRMTQTRMGVLFSRLESEDAAAIVQKLDEQKIQYKLSGDGTTIEVPMDKVPELRMKMTADGLPQGGTVGFEAFDKGSQFTTERAEEIKYIRAIQGELTRTICSLSPVMNARVMIVQPEKAVWESDQEPTTASVFLKLRRGTPLSDEQTSGIVRLVSSAVEGLKPENVTVVDSDGNVLSEGKPSASFGGLGPNNHAKFKSQIETDLSRNLQTMLAKIVGQDKVVVRVNADVSFDQVTSEQTKYNPTAGAGPKGVLENTQVRSETYNGNVIPPGGVTANPGGNNSDNDKYDKHEETSTYKVNSEKIETLSAPGKVQRLSVSVLVDDKVVPETSVPAIKAAVTAAAGVDAQRGDTIEVIRQPFDNTAKTQMDKEFATASKQDLYIMIAKNAGAALLLILFLVFLRSIVKQIKIQYPAPPAQLPEPEAEENPFAALEESLPTPEELIGNASQAIYEQTQNQIEDTYSTASPQEKLPPEVIHSNPEDLAKLVRTWMTEQ